jgi:hypothetical protein
MEAAMESIARRDTLDRMFRDAFRSTGNETEAAVHQRTMDERSYPNVVPVYQSIQNPLVHDFKGKIFRDESYRKLIDQAMAEGRDGLILKNTYDAGEYNRLDAIARGRFRAEDISVALRPEQIKSAIGNRGTFDPNDSRILYRRDADVVEAPPRGSL